MIGGILDPHSLENFISPIGCYNKSPIEKAVHALLVRELYRDGKKVFIKEQMPDDEVVDYSYQRVIERKTCELLDLDYEKTLVKIVANDLWSVFQWQKSVTILDWSVNIKGDTVYYSIKYLDEEQSMKIVYADNVPLNIREECDYWAKTKTFIENFESNYYNNNDSFGEYLIGLGYKLIARTFGYEVVSFNDWVKKEIEEYPDCKKLLREYLERHKFSESEINDIFGE